ncbi:MAG: NUDIX domain-containing protein [Acutalibacteraceae bacterium]|jgi:ADP-ribose pyrophosphatase
MNLEEKQIKFGYIYKGRIINLRKDEALLPNGHTAVREVIEHPGGVCVAALSDKNEILMVRQFRYPYGEVVLEIPTGKMDIGGESPLECGKRELLEEAGAVAENFFELGKLYPSPGYCGEIIWMYGATGLTLGQNRPDEDEFLTLEKIPLDDAVQMILSGEIKDAKTQAAVLKIKILKDKGII